MTSAERAIVADQTVTLSVVIPVDIRLHAPSTVELLHRYHVRLTKAGAAHEFIVVVDGSAPDLSAALRTQDLDGEAYVAFFLGDINDGQMGRTAPIREANTKWSVLTANWFAGTSKVVYLVCYVKAKRGVVHFDDIQLTELK